MRLKFNVRCRDLIRKKREFSPNEEFLAWIRNLFQDRRYKVALSIDTDYLLSPLFFPLALLKWRTYLMITQPDAAKLLYVNPATYKQWEKGKAVPALPVRQAVIKYIKAWVPKGLTLDDLVEEMKEQVKVRRMATEIRMDEVIESLEEATEKAKPNDMPRRDRIMLAIKDLLTQKKVLGIREIHDNLPYIAYTELVSIVTTMLKTGALSRVRTANGKYLYWVTEDKEAEDIAMTMKAKKIRM
jgi:DNA-binding XRE family transcriptional regulator